MLVKIGLICSTDTQFDFRRVAGNNPIKDEESVVEWAKRCIGQVNKRIGKVFLIYDGKAIYTNTGETVEVRQDVVAETGFSHTAPTASGYVVTRYITESGDELPRNIFWIPVELKDLDHVIFQIGRDDYWDLSKFKKLNGEEMPNTLSPETWLAQQLPDVPNVNSLVGYYRTIDDLMSDMNDGVVECNCYFFKVAVKRMIF